MKKLKGKITKLKKLRAKSRLTLAQLEELSGVDQATISKAENGHSKPYFSTLERLAESLNTAFENRDLSLRIEAEDLLEDDEAVEEKSKPAKKNKKSGEEAQLVLA